MATGATVYTFTDPGRGGSDPSDAFYRVETIDAANNTDLTPAVAAKAWVPVASGLNLLGMSVDPGPQTLGNLTNGLPWSAAWTYDACAGGFGWTRFAPAAGTAGIPVGRGFWFNATAGGRIVLLGVVQEQTQIRLCAGWNLVALPGFLGNGAAAALRAATGANAVVGFEPTGPFHTQLLGDSVVLAMGEGVWIRVPAAVTWTAAGW